MNAITQISRHGAEATDQEIPFASDKIIASATDGRGVISFANNTFCDIAKFELPELMGAPHKIVRHPDMPKAVFYILWETLKQGNPICAYVKNKAKNGDYYWVLAAVTLTDNGYLSARIHPGSDLFEATKGIYAEVLKAEAEGLTPEQSAALLIEKVQAAGFATLNDYSMTALDIEFKRRNITLDEYSSAFELMDEMDQITHNMRDLVTSIDQGFQRVRGEPVNLRILAGRLEGAGAALSTISQNYDAMAKEMHSLVGRLHDEETGVLNKMAASIAQGRSALQMAQLLKEAHAETADFEGPDSDHANLLKAHYQRLSSQSRTRLIEIASTGKSIPDICRSLRRRINGLDVVKLLCKVESGRMRDTDSGLDGIIARLEHFHDNTDKHLAELSSKASQITQKGSAL